MELPIGREISRDRKWMLLGTGESETKIHCRSSWRG